MQQMDDNRSRKKTTSNKRMAKGEKRKRELAKENNFGFFGKKIEVLALNENASNNKSENAISIRTAIDQEELQKVMELAVEEGWNVGKHDAKTYFQTFPKGCKILLVNEEVVG